MCMYMAFKGSDGSLQWICACTLRVNHNLGLVLDADCMVKYIFAYSKTIHNRGNLCIHIWGICCYLSFKHAPGVRGRERGRIGRCAEIK